MSCYQTPLGEKTLLLWSLTTFSYMLLLDSLEQNYKLIRRKFKPYLHNRQLKEVFFFSSHKFVARDRRLSTIEGIH